MGLDGGTKITRSDVLRRQSARWAQQDTSRSTRGGSVSQVYQERQLDEQIRRTVLWTTCALSGLPLVAPIVADALGQLFSKQAVLEHLLASKAAAATAATAGAAPAAAFAQSAALLPPTAAGRAPSHPSSTAGSIVPYPAPAPAATVSKDLAAACLRYENQRVAAAAAAAASGDAAAALQGTFEHIKSLRDVFVVQLTPNPDASAHAHAAAGVAQQGHAGQAGTDARQHSSNFKDLPSPWMCPITMQPCGSKQPFSALKPCGHVLSQKALAAITPAAASKAKAHASTAAGVTTGSKAASGAAHSRGNGVPAPPGQQQQEQECADEEGEVEGFDGVDACCCPVCEAPFVPGKDVVLLNGSQQHMDAVRAQLQAAAAAKAQAKQKKRKRAAAEPERQQQISRPLALPSS